MTDTFLCDSCCLLRLQIKYCIVNTETIENYNYCGKTAGLFFHDVELCEASVLIGLNFLFGVLSQFILCNVKAITNNGLGH